MTKKLATLICPSSHVVRGRSQMQYICIFLECQDTMVAVTVVPAYVTLNIIRDSYQCSA